MLREGVLIQDIDSRPLSVLRRMVKEKGIKIRSVATIDAMRNGEHDDSVQPPGFDNMLYPWQVVDKTVVRFHLKTE